MAGGGPCYNRRVGTDGFGGQVDEGHYLALSGRAFDYLRRAGGRAREDELIREVFGPAAKGALWSRLLAAVLARDARFERAPGGWALAGLAVPGLRVDEVDFVVLDVESTGLKPWRQRVVEVAALRLAGGRVVDSFASLVNPGRRLPGYLHDLAGFTQADLAGAPPFAAIADDLLAFLGSAVLVGHGLSLDIAYLQYELRRLGRPPLPNPILDTLDLAAELLPGHRKPTLDNLASLLGLPVGRRHRALSDAHLVVELFLHLLSLARARGAEKLADLPARGQAAGSRYALLDASPLRTVPERPGVYVLRDAGGRAVYVGKAANLRERLATYFSRPPEYVRRMEGLLEAVADFEVVPLGSELAALLEEARLIAALRPLFNVQRQTRGQPAFLRLDLQEEYPRLTACVEPAADGARYYGPLRNGHAVREALRRLGEIFPLRTCRRAVGRRRRQRPPACTKLGRGLCLGPCVDGGQRGEYRALAAEAARFLDGDREATLARLRAALAQAKAADDRPRVATVQKQLRTAQLFALPGRANWLAPSRANLAVIQPAAEDGAVEVFVLYGGRYAGKLSLSCRAKDVPSLAAGLRALAQRPTAAEGGEAELILRWLAEQASPPQVPLPVGDEGWEEAAGAVLTLAASVQGEGPADGAGAKR